MKSYLKTIDYSVTEEEFELMYDEELQMLITTPHPKNLDKYYDSQYYISHTDAKSSLFDKLYQAVKKFNIRKKARLVKKQVPNGKELLDIGAGTGDFLLALKNRNWEVNGVEPNFDARMRAQEKGVNLNIDIDSLPVKKYDVITLWHVLEHLPNLELQIKKIVSLLKNDGTLIIAVPNFKSYDANYYKEHWAAYDVPRHLWHFSKMSISKLFKKQKMEVVIIKPMVFDSFYVSLLSEKYKTGKQNYLKGFWTGLRSNMSAMSTKESSSLTYVLKKA